MTEIKAPNPDGLSDLLWDINHYIGDKFKLKDIVSKALAAARQEGRDENQAEISRLKDEYATMLFEKEKEIEKLKARQIPYTNICNDPYCHCKPKVTFDDCVKNSLLIRDNEKPAPGYCINDNNETDNGDPLCKGCLTGDVKKDNLV